MAQNTTSNSSTASGNKSCFDKFFGCLKRESEPTKERSRIYSDPQGPVSERQALVSQVKSDQAAEQVILPTPEKVFSPDFTEQIREMERKRRGELRDEVSIFSQIPPTKLSQAFPEPIILNSLRGVSTTPASLPPLRSPIAVEVVSELIPEQSQNPYSISPAIPEQSPRLGSVATANFASVTLQVAGPSPSEQQQAQLQQTDLKDRRMWQKFLEAVKETGYGPLQRATNEIGQVFTYYLQNNSDGSAVEGDQPSAQASQELYLYCVEEGKLYHGAYYKLKTAGLCYPAFRQDTKKTKIFYENGDEFEGIVESGKTRKHLFRRSKGTMKIEQSDKKSDEREWDNLDNLIGTPI